MTDTPQTLREDLTQNATDSDLLARLSLGDQQALAVLYDQHSKVVYSVALRVCRDAGQAEEVLQSVFLHVWLAPQQFAAKSASLGGYLAVYARNLAIDLMRKRKSDAPVDGPLNLRSTDPISHTEVRQLLGKPHALFLLLPDADRQLLEMAFFDGKTPTEIANETGNPLSAVTNGIRSALSEVRNGVTAASDDTGLEVRDLDSTAEFTERKLHIRDIALQMEGLRRLTHAFVENPDTILQELVNAAVELCGADSAGISLETEEKSDARFYHWVATAGQYNGFMDAVLPRYPSACGICLERSRPQLFRVRQRFFDIMGINAPLVTDGILLPWDVNGTRGTIFIMAHGRTAAFDINDGQMMRVLADFAAMAIRHQQQQRALFQQAKVAAAAEMANELAHRINNPLQSLMNVAYLAAQGASELDTRTLGADFSLGVQRISAVVNETLSPLPAAPARADSRD